MNNYVRRFTSLLRQALSLDYGADSPLGRAMAWLKERPADERDALFDRLAGRLATSEVRLPGAVLRWTVRDQADVDVPFATPAVDEASRLEAAMRRAEAEAFAFSDQDVLAGLLPHVVARTDGQPLRLGGLPVSSAEEAVRVLHAVGAARSAEGRRFLRVRKSAGRFENEYFSADDYEITADPQHPLDTGG
jgi:hypothetical protein